MPWNNQGGGGEDGGPWGNAGGGGRGGGGNGGSPWGQGGGGSPQDIDKLVRQGREAFGRMLPSGGKSLSLLIILAIAIWALTGFYRVNPQQQGVVLRFGEWVRTTAPGLHYHIPYPIEAVMTPEVTRDNRIEIGFRDVSGNSSSRRDIADESQMITGDENIVDIDFVVFWRISDAPNYLFNIRNPDETVKMAAESVMRAIIGQTPIQEALTSRREDIEARTLSSLQKLMSEYRAGIQVRQVQLLAVLPPKNVIDAFDEVSRARQDMDRLKNEAEAFRNDIVPRARGEAQQLLQGAEAYRQEVVNRAQGDANRFNSVYQAYRQAKDVTTTRIYLETLESIFSNVNKVIIDSEVGKAGGGVVPYLPLPEIKKKQQNNSSPQGANN